MVNFAHGEFLMLAMFGAFWGWALWSVARMLSLPLTTLALFVLGVLTYKGIIRWILGGPMLAQIFATFGLAIFLRSAAQFLFGVDFRLIQNPWVQGRISLGGLFIGLPQLTASAAALAAFAGLYWFLRRTETGLALQATAQDRQAAALMGINTERMFALGWGIGSACVGVAGSLLAIFFYVFPDVGATLALPGHRPHALGGFGSVPGSLVAGGLLRVILGLGGLLVVPPLQ